jgi:hypothetical protein
MAEANRGTKRQARTGSSNYSHSESNEDSTDDLPSLPGTATWILDDGSLTQKSKAPRRRKKFGPERRIEVAKVRKVGACKVCRARKVKVC